MTKSGIFIIAVTTLRERGMKMTREEIEMEISRLEDEIADLNNQIEEYEIMLDEAESEGK
jgi:hypothetical protein